MSVLLETSVGDLVIDLYIEKAPKSCLNFLKLCKLKYFNFCPVDSVVKGFSMQTGDPTGSSTGGQSIWSLIDSSKPKYFVPELHPKLKHKKKGIVSWTTVNQDPSGNLFAGSQFFITLSDEHLDYLDGKYAVFGHVAEGIDVLDKINQVLVDDQNRPFRDIRIKHTIILDDPLDDIPGMVVPEVSPEPTEEMLKSIRIGEDEEIFSKLDEETLEKQKSKEEAAARALTLEMVGDLPFAEIKPPENVLFVCKLNSVTRDEDLELIFSRFGPIVSCEVVRDKLTGDSLQYAFIEFEKKQDCEEAYFKMDNVLIDDRRIHVDFSQSVSKLHMGFLMGKNQRIDQEEFGGAKNIKKRARYRNDQMDKKEYDLVFEHGQNLDHEKEKRTRTRSTSREHRHGHDRKSHHHRRDSSSRKERRKRSEDRYRSKREGSPHTQDSRRYDRNSYGRDRSDRRRSRSPRRRY